MPSAAAILAMGNVTERSFLERGQHLGRPLAQAGRCLPVVGDLGIERACGRGVALAERDQRQELAGGGTATVTVPRKDVIPNLVDNDP